MMKKWLWLVLLIPILSCQAEIYKVTDKNGKVTYTNVPPEGDKVEPVDVKPPLILPPIPSIPNSSPNQNNNGGQTPYEIAITNPSAGVQLAPEERTLLIQVSVNQLLADGDLIEYLLDGKNLITSTETEYLLNEPPRGEHELTVEVVTEKGEVLAVSSPVKFLVIRPRVKGKK